MKHYIAYGSNLNKAQMAYRCKGAVPVGTTTLKNHRLIFRGNKGNAHATVEPAAGQAVPIALWKITLQDEHALDLYEGVPRYYTKEYLPIEIDGEVYDALIYIMVDKPANAPTASYYRTIESGYEQFGFDTSILETALLQAMAGERQAEYENNTQKY